MQPLVTTFKNSLQAILLSTVSVLSVNSFAQNTSSIEEIEIPESRMPLCFGFRDISDLRALAICDALNLKQNVKARELSEKWLREEPDSAASQFALSEVLLTIEGNMPRALFHLNRAEELTNYQTLEDAFASGNVQWHYLTLSQLSYVHQLMGDQLSSLAYLDKLNEVYGQDVESFRGWPLVKLKDYEGARESANRVLETSENENERARAWNTLCAAELASLQVRESIPACDRAIDEDENLADPANDNDTVYLSNASEVALSLLQMDKAEEFLNRATRTINPDSVANPWIYKLYLTLNQGRFDEARSALDRMLIWREAQEPIVNVMNRAEHYLASASFLLLAGYAEDANTLSSAALNQPDRNGSYSADESQKDSAAALINMAANMSEYQILLEDLASMDFIESLSARVRASQLRLAAWRSGKRAASLFADFEVLQNRVRPYAPLDVHIPEWLEPEIVSILGTGVMSVALEQARGNGAFGLNEGYYFSYRTEVASIKKDNAQVIEFGAKALELLPAEEVLLQARLLARMGEASLQLDQKDQAINYLTAAYQQDPSIIRRLGISLPVTTHNDSTLFSTLVDSYLSRSPRFHEADRGFRLEIKTGPDQSVCLKSAEQILTCYNAPSTETESSKWNAQHMSRSFHANAFGLGFDISKAQRSILLGSSVILSSQTNSNLQQTRDAVLNR
jgi:hypothetical protein